MLQEPTVMLDNLVLSLSDSLDLIHPSAVDHQQRVAYIALRIAKAMGHHPAEQADLMYASVLHDIGLLSVEEKDPVDDHGKQRRGTPRGEMNSISSGRIPITRTTSSPR